MISSILSERVSVKASEEERSSSPDRERSRGRSSGQSIDFLIYVMGRPFFEKSLTKFYSPWKASAKAKSREYEFGL
jgi:hypothetical protein